MVIDRSEVQMRSQSVTYTRREHTIHRDSGAAPLKSSDETIAISPLTTNNPDMKQAVGIESVRKLVTQLERAAAKKKDETDEWLLLRLKLILAWLLLQRLFGLEEEDNPCKDKKSVWKTGIPSGDRARSGSIKGAAAPAPAVTGGETLTETRETLFFEAHGKVVTKDGEESPVDIRLKLDDDRREITGLDKETARALVDPLVVNFENESVQLSDRKFSFDLDIDGVPENITMPASGSAFLALDRNGDGVIGDGSELFGVASGDGFKDLAVFDDDKNGFIDEGDKIYDKLCLFTRAPDGKDVVFTLREKGVKAISLENLATSLRLKGGDAQLRKTGFIIRENKTASTVQHVDLRPEPLIPAQNAVKPPAGPYDA